VSSPAQPSGAIADVIARMQSIDAALPAHDGVACFNRMYLDVTQQVEQHIEAGAFSDPAFLTSLDVVFADLYFAAVDAPDLASVPTSWRPLFATRSDPTIEPIQFALAGMNAHINHDLPVAVVSTCTDQASAPIDGSHYADYQKVDALLDAAEQSVRQSFETGAELALDRHLLAVDNLVCNWSINEARDLAWDSALLLWEVRDHAIARDLLLGVLVRTVAMASGALLVAV
jgi:hypothetical protein